ncbi:hypothetical protein GCM10010082_31870 [Kushneria pakistanensis]|uniref:Uncharacterized protein n=1 Tax=Kushneria pakistanensis TaxID=1508770 RepID=A0ABQ3FR45_9GAMM|nr:hypothetical protein GCM10010082_31870 [Kushneria pakistanensis]
MFHRFHCDPCAGVGYLQRDNSQPVDLLAAGILSRHRQSSSRQQFETTPDTWTLRGDYRGD